MRHLALCMLLLAAPAAARADQIAADIDDPKVGAAGSQPSTASSPIALSPQAPADAPVAVERSATRTEHANPRLKLSYRGFGITGFDGGTVGLKGGQLDLYPVSRRFFRMGIEAEAGSGDATINGTSTNVWYGMGGVSAGFQFPARVTPFVEGRVAAGALGGNYSGALGTVAGQTVSVQNQSAATFMYVGGVDAGIEVYAVSRLYVSASLGWAHPVYTGPDMAAMQSNPTAGMQFKQVAADTFTFKVGLGI